MSQCLMLRAAGVTQESRATADDQEFDIQRVGIAQSVVIAIHWINFLVWIALICYSVDTLLVCYSAVGSLNN